jgi:P4 family phage/plasmid primase-like protien
MTQPVPDIEDLLAEEFAKARAGAGPTPINTSRGTDLDRGVITEVAAALQNSGHYARDPGGKLYVYRNGSYVSADRHIAKRTTELLATWKKEPKWRSALPGEVAERIAVDCPELWEAPPLDRVNVSNGIVELARNRLLPHSPDYLSTVQLPVTYDPEAKPVRWQTFAEQVFPEDAVGLVYEIPALLMTPNTSIQKALLPIGEGANGKSTYLRALIAFLGRANVSSLSLHRLEADRFAVSRLIGKLANICPDLPTEHLSGTSMFKAITGGDVIPAEYKYRDGFDFVPFARLVFSANRPPKSQADNSEGFFRRWLVVPFTRTFSDTDTATIPREILDAALVQPEELSGVLNEAIKVWRRVRTHGLTESASMRAAWDELRAATDPFAVWLDRYTVTHSEAVTPQSVMIEHYARYAERTGAPAMTKTGFGRALKRYRPKVIDAKRTVSDSVPWCYVGIGLVTEAE